MSTQGELLEDAFFHNDRERIRAVKNLKSGQMFSAHYTDAQNLFRILEGKSVFLRNARTLGDYTEIDHGFRLIEKAVGSPSGERLSGAITSIWPNYSLRTIWDLFVHNHMLKIREETYVFSMCEHPVSGKARDFGRLSMWRCYGGASRPVALVINPFRSSFIQSDAVGMYTFPVEYVVPDGDGDDGLENWILREFCAIADVLVSNRSQLSSVDPAIAAGYMMRSFHLMGVRSKHKAFEEEKEWRVVWTPYLAGPLPPGAIEITNYFGYPQKILRLNLGPYSGDGTTSIDLSLNNILHKVLIGPASDADLVRHSVIAKLEEAGVRDAASRVEITNIPLRTSGSRP